MEAWRGGEWSVERRAGMRPVTSEVAESATSKPAAQRLFMQHGYAGVVPSRSRHDVRKRCMAPLCLACACDTAAPFLPCQAATHGNPPQPPPALPHTSKKPGWRASASGPSSTKWRKASCRYTVHMRGTCMGQGWRMGRGVWLAI